MVSHAEHRPEQRIRLQAVTAVWRSEGWSWFICCPKSKIVRPSVAAAVSESAREQTFYEMGKIFRQHVKPWVCKESLSKKKETVKG